MRSKAIYSIIAAGLLSIAATPTLAAERPYQPSSDIPVAVQQPGAQPVNDPAFNPTAQHTKQTRAQAKWFSPTARFVPQPDPTFNPTYQHTKW